MLLTIAALPEINKVFSVLSALLPTKMVSSVFTGAKFLLIGIAVIGFANASVVVKQETESPTANGVALQPIYTGDLAKISSSEAIKNCPADDIWYFVKESEGGVGSSRGNFDDEIKANIFLDNSTKIHSCISPETRRRCGISSLTNCDCAWDGRKLRIEKPRAFIAMIFFACLTVVVLLVVWCCFKGCKDMEGFLILAIPPIGFIVSIGMWGYYMVNISNNNKAVTEICVALAKRNF